MINHGTANGRQGPRLHSGAALPSITRDVYRSHTTRIFQHFTLGSKHFEETYGLTPEFKTDSYLLLHDETPIDAEIRAKLIQPGHHLGTLTNRPSGPPRAMGLSVHGYPPEAELALEPAGLKDIPSISFGRIEYLAAEHNLDPAALVKPSPFHALAGVLAAWTGEEWTALQAAHHWFETGSLNGKFISLPRTFDLITAFRFFVNAEVSADGHNWSKMVAAVAKRALAFERSGGKTVDGKHLPAAEVMDYVDANAVELAASATYRAGAKAFARIAGGSYVATWHFLLRQTGELGLEYIEQIVRGEGLRRSDPAMTVRDRLFQMGRSNLHAKTEAVLRGWVYFRDGKPLHRVQLMGELSAS